MGDKSEKERVREEVDLEKKMTLWQWALDHGWIPLGKFNCLYSNGYKTRLNFRHDRLLRLEEKQPSFDEEKIQKRSNWVVIKSQSYGKVTVKEDGLDWMEKKKKKGVK